MRRRIVILFLIAAIVCAAGWILWRRLVVAPLNFVEKKGEEPLRQACDRIVAVGERAIPAVISSIEEHSPWVRRHCYLPIVLKEIGGSAHSEVADAIEKQKDPRKRAFLISTLQSAFGDYSRLDSIIDDFESGRISSWGLIHIASNIRYIFVDAPPFLTEDRQINPEFKIYWKKRSEHDGVGDTRPALC